MTERELLTKWKKLHADPAERETLRPELRDSWERCYAYGVDKYLRENAYICTRAELNNYRDKAGFLIETSGPIMDSLYEFISGTGFTIVLSDANLCIVKVIGFDEEAQSFAKNARLCEGVMWSEELVGTNAAALAVALAKPISVFGYEHFCLFSHVASCSVAPIIDQGKICGSLGMVAPFNKVSNHTLGMVVAATKHIKYKMAMERAERYHEILIDSLQEGMFAIDIDGNITFMNDNCAKSLNIKKDTVVGRSIYEFLGHNQENQYFLNKITSGRRTVDEDFSLVIGRHAFHCNVTCNPLQSSNQDEGAVIVIRESQRIKRLVRNIIGSGAKMTFGDIMGRDPEFLLSLKNSERRGIIPV